MRDLERDPYDRQEERVCDYLLQLTDLGCGDDPVGFLIASHRAIVEINHKLIAALERVEKERHPRRIASTVLAQFPWRGS